jgi:hypothetical protein
VDALGLTHQCGSHSRSTSVHNCTSTFKVSGRPGTCLYRKPCKYVLNSIDDPADQGQCARRPSPPERPDAWDADPEREDNGPHSRGLRGVEWSGRRDSNPRSPGPEPGAIPGFATSRRLEFSARCVFLGYRLARCAGPPTAAQDDRFEFPTMGPQISLLANDTAVIAIVTTRHQIAGTGIRGAEGRTRM